MTFSLYVESIAIVKLNYFFLLWKWKYNLPVLLCFVYWKFNHLNYSRRLLKIKKCVQYFGPAEIKDNPAPLYDFMYNVHISSFLLNRAYDMYYY